MMWYKLRYEAFSSIGYDYTSGYRLCLDMYVREHAMDNKNMHMPSIMCFILPMGDMADS